MNYGINHNLWFNIFKLPTLLIIMGVQKGNLKRCARHIQQYSVIMNIYLILYWSIELFLS